MYRTTLQTSAGDVVMRLPRVASEALEFLAWIWPRLIHCETVEGEADAHAEAIIHLTQWLGRYAEHIEGADKIQQADPACFFDKALPFAECITLAIDLCRRASLPEPVIAEIHDWMESVQVSECKCVRCTDPDSYDKSSEKTRAIIDGVCQRVTPSLAASIASNQASAAKDSDLLNGPWHIYEVRAAIENGKAAGAIKRRREEERRAAFREKMKPQHVTRRRK